MPDNSPMFYVIAVTFCVNSLKRQRRFSRAYHTICIARLEAGLSAQPEPHQGDL